MRVYTEEATLCHGGLYRNAITRRSFVNQMVKLTLKFWEFLKDKMVCGYVPPLNGKISKATTTPFAFNSPSDNLR